MDQDRRPERSPGDSDPQGRTDSSALSGKTHFFGRRGLLWWARQSFGIRAALLAGGIGGAVFLAVLASGRLHTSPPPALNGLPIPGPMGFRPRGPVRTVPQTPVDVAGIRSAGGPDLRDAPSLPSSPSSPGLISPPLQTLSSAPSQAAPPSPEILERQMGAVVVEVAGLSEAVRRLEAENAALLKGQEWIERTMGRGLPSREGRSGRNRSSDSAPLSDDRTGSPSPSSPPILAGWRVIGVSGTGAVLVDPSGQDHLVRKGQELLGVAVTGIDPETGAVAFSDGEVLKP